MFTSSRNFRQFVENDRGSIAIVFAIAVMAVALLVGAAVDSARAYRAAAQAGAAVDSAALAAAKALSEDENADIQEIAKQFFATNTLGHSDQGIRYGDVTADQDGDGSVTVTVSGDIDSTFMQIAGIDKIDFTRSASAAFNTRNLELGLMLDVTGSMSGNKIEDLKDAAKDLVDILKDKDPNDQRVKIGLAPYSDYVNAGPYAKAVSNVQNSQGCVWERTNAAYEDDAPSANKFLSSTANGLGSGCPKEEVLPITSNSDTLKSRIDNLRTYNRTAGHLGIAWAWYLISPSWSSIWPSDSRPVDYGDGKTLKAVILMTDGIFNQSYKNGSSEDQARQLCANMKAKGVVVYSVAFQAPPTAADLLHECAANAGNFFDAKNGDELKAAFRSIAVNLANLRLTK